MHNMYSLEGYLVFALVFQGTGLLGLVQNANRSKVQTPIGTWQTDTEREWPYLFAVTFG